jgi:hypothetical protein
MILNGLQYIIKDPDENLLQLNQTERKMATFYVNNSYN